MYEILLRVIIFISLMTVGVMSFGCVSRLLGRVFVRARSSIAQVSMERRGRKAAVQLPDFLSRTNQYLKASVSFQEALENASVDTPSPLGSEVMKVCRMISAGEGVTVALRHLARALPNREMILFVESSIELRKAGAGLSEMMGRISAMMKNRMDVNSRIEAKYAQGKYQAIVLSLLPWFMLLSLFVIHPAYIAPLLETRLGLSILAAALLLQTLGLTWLIKIIRIER